MKLIFVLADIMQGESDHHKTEGIGPIGIQYFYRQCHLAFHIPNKHSTTVLQLLSLYNSARFYEIMIWLHEPW